MGDEVEIKEERMTLASLWTKAVVVERPFTSANPRLGRWIVRFRELWNGVATLWYVRPLLDQQNIFNQTLLHFLEQEFYAQQVQINALQGQMARFEQLLADLENQTWAQNKLIHEQQQVIEAQQQVIEAQQQVIGELQLQLKDQNMRLVMQDRAWVTAVHDGGELSTHLTQLDRRLQELEARFEARSQA